MKNNKNKKGFTLIEILMILAIVGILASIILTMGISRGRDRAAINSYKTTMNSVKTAVELCGDNNRIFLSNITSRSPICISGTSMVYPELGKCGEGVFTLSEVEGDPNIKWVVTSEPCKGCQIYCTIEGCQATVATEDVCR